MRHVHLALALALLVLAGPVRAQQADHIVISELRYWETSGVNEEFVELYNPTDTAVDLGGWKIQYKSYNGATWHDKQTFPAGTQLPSHHFLLYGGTATVPAPDFASATAPGLGNSGGHVRLVDASLATIDRVAWLTGDTPEGTAISSPGVRGSSYERKAIETSTAADMAPGGAHDSDGNGWDAGNNNADFVVHTAIANANPQNSDSAPEPDVPLTDGSGTASISPALVDAPAPVDLTLTLTGEDYELRTVELELPAGWTPASVQLEGEGFAGATLETEAGIYRALDAHVTAQAPGIFQIAGCEHPMATAAYAFTVRTAVEGGTPVAIAESPAVQVLGDPIAIEELHVNGPDGLPLLLGETVVIRGVVTADEQLGVAVYLQDGSGGTVGYSAGLSAVVDVGDDVTVMGTVTHFNGLTELTPAELMQTHGSGLEVEPTVLTTAQVNAQGAAGEPYEGMLIRINGVTVQGSGTWAGNTNYTITDASGTGVVRVNAASELVGAPIPSGTFDLLGVLGQYDTSSPYHSGYQLQPRFVEDVIELVGPGIVSGPVESEHTTSSVRLSWTTRNPGDTQVSVGSAWPYGGITLFVVDESVTEHSYVLEGMDPGTPYIVNVGSEDATGTSWSGEFHVSTVSGQPGSIEVLFTQDAETDLALPGNEAQDDQENQITGRLNGIIDAAETSIDCAVYSLNIASVAAALIEAHDRGVAVRFIYDSDHAQPEVQQLENAGITVIDESFGQHPGSGIQHNKFLVVDAADEDPANDLVWTGSVNLIDAPNDNGIHAKDNAIIIRDQAVARAYTLEFNEMWGSDTMTPDPAQSRFGEYKTNNTPHRFTVGGVSMEVWFSHGDNVSQRIVDLLETADESVYFCIYVFSRNEIGYAMRDAHERGAAVRGVFDSVGDQFSEWITLTEFGADIHVTDGGGILHHKYMILDGDAASEPAVVAGSYNWSNSAEDTNNENTLVFHDALIANQYLQEFAARYHQAGGQEQFSDLEAPAPRPRRLEIAGLYPNPFNPSTLLELNLPLAGAVRLEAFDLAGRRVWSRDLGQRPAGRLRERLDFSGQASGLYLLRAESPAGSATTKMLLVR